MTTQDHRKEREEMEKEWAEYDLRRSAFMKKMGWDEKRMTKHEAVCQKRQMGDGPSEGLVGICFGLAVAALFLPPVNQALREGYGWLIALIFPFPVIPMGLAYLFNWLAKLMRDDLPVFVSARSWQECSSIRKARGEVERATGEVEMAYCDLRRYVAPHWIGKAEFNLRTGLAQEKDGLEYLAGLEKVSDDWHEVMRTRCLPGWPVGAKNVVKLQDGNLYIRESWYERHRERVARNDQQALSLAERRASPPAKNTSTAPVALPKSLGPRVTHAPSPSPVKPVEAPAIVEPVQAPPVSDGLSGVIRRGSIITKKPDAPRFPLIPDEFIPPAGFRDSVEPEPNYPAEDVGFTPPAGFRISVPEPVPVPEPEAVPELAAEPEAVTVAAPEPEAVPTVSEPAEPEPPPVTADEPKPEEREAVTVVEPEEPEPEAPAVLMIEPEPEAPEAAPVPLPDPAPVRPFLPSPPRMPESDRPARSPRPRTPREKPEPEYEPEPAVEGGRKLRTNYAVVRNPKLRAMAIQIHGRNCCVCSFNFDAFFGPELAQGYIEIHHLSKIADGERSTDPATDLAPLCGNCHAMADRLAGTLANPPATIEELKRLLVPHKPA